MNTSRGTCRKAWRIGSSPIPRRFNCRSTIASRSREKSVARMPINLETLRVSQALPRGASRQRVRPSTRVAMANYQSIARLRPEVRQFIRNRRWVHRGDIVTYGPNTNCESFSTDSAGFRHSVFDGETLSVDDCLRRERYGLVLGSSNLYSFGLAGNENTIPSRLAAEFGFPFANISIPEANGRNLFALLTALVAKAAHPPAVVLYMSGGDFTGFCYTYIADPVFGSPNLMQRKMALQERGGRPKPETQMKPLLAFTSL